MANILDYIKWRGDLGIKQDGFNEVVGWKEDFSMSFKGHVISQKDAAKYLDEVAKEYPNMIRVGDIQKVEMQTNSSKNRK